MADNIHNFEYWASVGITIIGDDGTGTDWITISGEYYANPFDPLSQYGAMINLNWGYIYGGGFAAAMISVYYTDPSVLTDLLVNGLIENVQGGGGSDSIYGTTGVNVLVGDPSDVAGGNDFIRSGGGMDRIEGGGGSDVIYGEAESERIFGEFDMNLLQSGRFVAGNDYIFAAGGFDVICGGGGENSIQGGTGTDTLDYSQFFDDHNEFTFSVVIDLNFGGLGGLFAGYATVTATNIFGDAYVLAIDRMDGIEAVIGTLGDDTIVGGRDHGNTLEGRLGHDRLTSGYYADTLSGGAGNDILTDIGNVLTNPVWADRFEGGAGDDVYRLLGTGSLFNTAMFSIIEAVNAGRDRVESHSSLTLQSNVEDLTLIGPAALTGTGNALNNVIIGTSTNNTLNGLLGNDSLYGGSGNDWLIGAEGADYLVGGAGSDFLWGGPSIDILYGQAGQDQLVGGIANDVLFGGDGNDTLIGDEGRDNLAGGTGNDRFVFRKLSDLGTTVTDVITDFVSGQDRIDLRLLQPGLHYIGTGPFGGIAGQVRFDQTASDVLIDLNGDMIADARIDLISTTALTVGDFIL